MKKKLLMILAAAVVFMGLGLVFKQVMPKKEVGSKELIITITNTIEGKELYSKTIKTDALTLGELLDEREDFEAVLVDSDFGRYVISLLGVEGEEDWSIHWLYDSPNNKACQEAGYCTGADDLPIYDGDEFNFTFHAKQ